MLESRAQELSPCSSSTRTHFFLYFPVNTLLLKPISFLPHALLSFLPPFPLSLPLPPPTPPFPPSLFLSNNFNPTSIVTFAASTSSSHSTFVEQLACEPATNENWDFNNSSESEAAFGLDKNDGSLDLKQLPALALDVKELEVLPEQWRRSKLAWLCKEPLAHKAGTLVQILNAQRKWMRQADATFVAVHCLWIRENEAGFKVYKWMMQQHWYQFDFCRYQAS